MHFALLERQGTHTHLSLSLYTVHRIKLTCFCLDFCKVIDFDLPITVKLKIVDVDPGLRGDTAQGNNVAQIGSLVLVLSSLSQVLMDV